MPSAASFTKCLALSALVAGAAALPTGAPKCQINPSVIGAAHSAPSPSAGYTLTASSATWSAGQKITVTVTGTTSEVVGVLMYATPEAADDAALAPNGSKSHLGVFNVPEGFRAQTADICAGAKVEQQALESTITHANPTPKGKSVTFEWTAPASGSTAITFNAAVASGGPGNPWMVVPIVTLQPAAATGGAPTPSTPAGPGSPAAVVTFTTGGIETSSPAPTGTAGEDKGSKKKCSKGKKHGKWNKHPMPKEGEMPMPKEGEMPMPKEGEMPMPKEGEMPMPKEGEMPMPMPKEGGEMPMPQVTAASAATETVAVEQAYPPSEPTATQQEPVAAPTYAAPEYPSAPAATEASAVVAASSTETASPDSTVLSGASSNRMTTAWVTLAGAAIASGFFLLA
ncbi:hypothetical protein HDU86_004197 [Geranomyces michiganensis]|nr:hypothetical protein HDU86_004197 [Geranomyces michiganensis]